MDADCCCLRLDQPEIAGLEEELRRCVEQHGMAGIRCIRITTGTKSTTPDFARLLRMASRAPIVGAARAVMEDERMMHPHLRVEAVDLAPSLS